jgi:SAM-dependent methyltransferase
MDTGLPTVRDFWDTQSARYDEDPDHGLRDPAAREAWRAHLAQWLPEPPATVLDLGCGTGSLSLLALEAGHRVRGVDLSPAMVAEATVKCAGLDATFTVGDAAEPPASGPVDAVLARHLLWTLPDPHGALRHWVGLLRPGGRLVLVEGRWWPAGAVRPYAQGTETMPWQGGVRAEDLVAALDPLVERLEVVCLSSQPVLWGRDVDDERYAVVATTPTG